MKEKTVAILLIFMFLATLSLPTLGESVSQPSEGLYNRLQAYFYIGQRTHDFETAMLFYEKTPQLANYADAEKYYRYMSAWKLLRTGEVENGALLFQSLGDFLDSLACHYYAAGRIAESEGRFEEAVALYLEASSVPVEDSVSRMIDCNAHISDERKKEQYLDAVNSIEAVLSSGDIQKITSLWKVFQGLGEYEEAKAYASRCEVCITSMLRHIDIDVLPEVDALTVQWTDEDNHRYNMLWSVQHLLTQESILNAETPLTLEGLIPNTEYWIRIEDANNPAVFSETTVKTAAAAKTSSLKAGSMTVAGIVREETVLNNLDPTDVFNDYPVFLLNKDGNAFTSSDLSDYALYAGVVYKNLTGKEIKAKVTAVLRSASFGVYKSVMELVLPEISEDCLFCVSVDDLLSFLQNDYGLFPDDSYAIEIYVDGQYLNGVRFSISQN